MKAIFIGAVGISEACLNELLSEDVDLRAIITVKSQLSSEISGYVSFDKIAGKANIPLYKVKSINSKESLKIIQSIAPDVIFVIGWKEIVGRDILKIPRRGVIGMHSSLLPKYRGHAPVNWAIINGEKKTGITMMYLNRFVDKGNIIAQKAVKIEFSDDCNTVYRKLALKARLLIKEYLRKPGKGAINKGEKQQIFLPAMPRRRPEDGLINWRKNTLDLYNWIRALTKPYPGAFSYYRGKKFFFWKARISRAKRYKDMNVSAGTIIGKQGNKALIVKSMDGALNIIDYGGAGNKGIVMGKRFE